MKSPAEKGFLEKFQHLTLKDDLDLGLIWTNVWNGKSTHDT